MRQKVDLGDRKVIIIGTEHVSKDSVKEVEETLEQERPDIVGVELDQDRLKALRGSSQWKELDIVEAIKNGKGYLLAANLFLSIYQKKLGLEEGVKPGAELLKAVNVAEEKDIPVKLVDRNINDTFRRAYNNLSFWEKLKIGLSVLPGGEEVDIELEEDILDELVKELENEFPTIGQVFLEERNHIMAEKLLENDFETAVLVVGAAHVKGVEQHLRDSVKYEEKDIRPTKIFSYIAYGFPFLIIGLMVLGLATGGLSQLVEMGVIWISLNALLAGVGAIIAQSHIKTWIVSAAVSPITSMTPVIGAGIVAAYVEAKYYPPTVEELEEITEITSYRELWGNQVGIIILTLVFVSLLGAAATFIAAGLMALTFL